MGDCTASNDDLPAQPSVLEQLAKRTRNVPGSTTECMPRSNNHGGCGPQWDDCDASIRSMSERKATGAVYFPVSFRACIIHGNHQSSCG